MTLQLMAVGCGTVFDQYYKCALKKLESRGIVRVVALVDPNPGRIAAIAKDFSVGPRVYHPRRRIRTDDAGSHDHCVSAELARRARDRRLRRGQPRALRKADGCQHR